MVKTFSGRPCFMNKHMQKLCNKHSVDITNITDSDDEDIVEYELAGGATNIAQIQNTLETLDNTGEKFGGSY